MKKVVLKNFAIFTGKLQACNFIKSRLQYRCFPLDIAKFLRTFFYFCFEEHLLTPASDFLKQLQNTGEQLLTLLLSSDNLLAGYEQLS